jgi:hypothetical protein
LRNHFDPKQQSLCAGARQPTAELNLTLGRFAGTSGSKRVQSMGNENSDAQNNEKCCYRLEHGWFPRNRLN